MSVAEAADRRAQRRQVHPAEHLRDRPAADADRLRVDHGPGRQQVEHLARQQGPTDIPWRYRGWRHRFQPAARPDRWQKRDPGRSPWRARFPPACEDRRAERLPGRVPAERARRPERHRIDPARPAPVLRVLRLPAQAYCRVSVPVRERSHRQQAPVLQPDVAPVRPAHRQQAERFRPDERPEPAHPAAVPLPDVRLLGAHPEDARLWVFHPVGGPRPAEHHHAGVRPADARHPAAPRHRSARSVPDVQAAAAAPAAVRQSGSLRRAVRLQAAALPVPRGGGAALRVREPPAAPARVPWAQVRALPVVRLPGLPDVAARVLPEVPAAVRADARLPPAPLPAAVLRPAAGLAVRRPGHPARG